MNSQKIIRFIRDLYQSHKFIPLHEPIFDGNEIKYVTNTVNSTFVSSVGEYVDKFEWEIDHFTGAQKSIATVNGTAALHTALYVAGVKNGDLILTQPMTFVATCNVLHHMGAEPIFIDISPSNLSLCPVATQQYLESYARINSKGECIHIPSGRQIKVILPMHTFGHPADLDSLSLLCQNWNLALVEDAAESLGSFYKNKHTGTIGDFGAISFNGNKIITTGGGGMVLCKHQDVAKKVKHITTTAKSPHPYEFYHDQPGFNYRLPNINAALGCAQMESLTLRIQKKRELAEKYIQFFKETDFRAVEEPSYARSNYWLNAIICPDTKVRDELLNTANSQGVMTRPVWQLMHHLPMFKHCFRGELPHSERLAKLLVNLPSTPIMTG